MCCLLFQKEEFHLYSVYCQNKTRSETLRNQVGDQNPFFLVSPYVSPRRL